MIRILAVGKMKERRLAELVDDFIRRIRPWSPVEIVELKDSTIEKEGAALVRWLDGHAPGRIVACDERGREPTSRDLAGVLRRHRAITFVIGGPDGLAPAVRDRADETVALSRLTMTHEMCRLLLAEQIYRGLAINRGHRYHRD